MNYKLAIACAAALGVVGTTAAQIKPKAGDTADFVIKVPLVLERMAPEIHSVAVWCEIVNFNAAGAAGGGARRGADYQGQPNMPVIATAGPLIIPVQGYAPPPAGSAAAAKGVPPKPRPAWSVLRIESRDRTGKPAEIKASAPLNLKPPAILPTEFMILPHGGPANSDAAVILQANTQGATDPALGNAYGCHIAFRATAQIDGKQTDFSVFGTDPGNYTGLPSASGSALPRPDGRPNRDAVLHVYGEIPVKPRP
jgi:hypothetical protein